LHVIAAPVPGRRRYAVVSGRNIRFTPVVWCRDSRLRPFYRVEPAAGEDGATEPAACLRACCTQPASV